MKKIFFILSFLPVFAFAQTTWHTVSSDVSFKIKNGGIPVKGSLEGLKTELKFSPEKLGTSHIKGSVEVATIKTGINKRDKDLKGEKFFDADKYKIIEISSNKLYKKDAQYAGTFKVTMKGVTKEMEIPFTFTQNGKEADFQSSFTLNRRDFGVGGKTLTMSDEVHVSIDIKAKE